MNQPHGVLIVEDDFRISDINRQFVEHSPGFRVLGEARTRAEALAFLAGRGEEVSLILLDAYIPDATGLELLWEIRRLYRHIDIVMVTAAREVDTIQEALRGGVFDYLIKPTQQERMAHMLDRFLRERSWLEQKQEISQEELDQALNRRPAGRPQPAPAPAGALPKGIDKLTLDTVIATLVQARRPQTAVELAQAIGASRSTARRYLEFLVSRGEACAEQAYGEVGRPERRYRLSPDAGP
ncbi:response regulator [Zobellella taiwanensis]|jgi:CitB family two-component system response regulator CitT|uniref:Transcriptional regulatory protein n=1 Tax=Zobellella taiwanensis TaxID=347535 RepID=A0A2P7R9C5_9GAMM|nr:response regulator [Zobellella taiwanensis]PSJ46811.1 response regulator [Zobellella taiwanensis]